MQFGPIALTGLSAVICGVAFAFNYVVPTAIFAVMTCKMEGPRLHGCRLYCEGAGKPLRRAMSNGKLS
jgi:hypothetical protein